MITFILGFMICAVLLLSCAALFCVFASHAPLREDYDDDPQRKY